MAATTTGEKLVELSSLTTGTAMEHLLHIQSGVEDAPNIYALDIIGASGVGVSDGEITILASGGTSPYEYSIGGAYQVDNVFTNLPEDTYTISVRDVSGHTDTISGIELSAPSNTPVITDLITINTSSLEVADGSIEVIVAGGSLPYEYSVNDGVYQSENIFMKLSAGIYNVTVKDADGVLSKLGGIRVSAAQLVGGGRAGGSVGGAGVNRFRPSVRVKNVNMKDVEEKKKIKVKVTL